MTQREDEGFVRDAVEDYLRAGRSGAFPELEAFLEARAGGDARRAELLRSALEAARAGGQATLPLPPTAGAGATQPLGDPPPGRLIDGRYRVERELGEGGFGVVYLVRDELFAGARRALKTLRPELTRDPGVAQRFRNEMVVVKALSHPYVPRFHNDGRTPEGEFYYVMDFVEGVGLDALLRKEGALAPERIVRLVRQLLDVLEYAHGKGVFHRDLKPANILLVDVGTDREQVRVLDFGIAKILSKSGEFADLESMHTLHGGAIGTPHYMAPEQVTGQGRIDGRTDLYSLGVILYQMCSGRVPFTGKTSMEVAAARLTQAPPPLDEDTPAWLRGIVMHLLQRQQEKRPTTQELREGLEALASGQRRLHRSLTFVAAGILAVALGVTWVILDRPGAEETGSGARGERPAPTPRPAGVATAITIHSPAEGQRTREPDLEVHLDAPGQRTVFLGEIEVPVGPDGAVRANVRLPADVPSSLVVRAADGTELGRRNVMVDTRAPRLTVERPERVVESRGAWFTSESRLELHGTLDDGEHGELPPKPVVIPGAQDLEFDDRGGFRAVLLLEEGTHPLEISGRDRVGHAATFTRTLHVDRSEPRIRFTELPERTQAESLRLEGRIEDASECRASVRRAGEGGEGRDVSLDHAGRFALDLSLEPGFNEFELLAVDALGQRAARALRIERVAISVAVQGVDPPSGRRFSAAEARARLSARTNLAVTRVEVTRGERRLDVEFRPDGGGFDLDLPLALGVNVFHLTPYDARDVAGEAFEVTYLRESPPLPPGCVLPADFELDASGRPVRLVHERSGLELVLVDGTRGAGEPAPFYLARHETTIGDLLRWRPGFYAESMPTYWGEIANDRGHHPATRLSFAQGRELAAELGLRLPTTREWELAAAGPGGFAFPWGEELRPRAANARDPEDGWPYTAPVGSFPTDRSAFGLLDMAGNASEWCTEPDGRAALRGGNWTSEPENCRVDHPRNPPAGASDTIGVRFALDAPR